MMQYDGKLFHKASHSLSCQFGRIFCNTTTTVSFLLHRRELGILFCAAHVSKLCLHIWHIIVHIDLGNGDRDNLMLSFLIKVNK